MWTNRLIISALLLLMAIVAGVLNQIGVPEIILTVVCATVFLVSISLVEAGKIDFRKTKRN